MTNNDLQNITQKTKDRAARTPLKTEDDLATIVHSFWQMFFVGNIENLLVQPVDRTAN
jgi:hypothetical protein